MDNFGRYIKLVIDPEARVLSDVFAIQWLIMYWKRPYISYWYYFQMIRTKEEKKNNNNISKPIF